MKNPVPKFLLFPKLSTFDINTTVLRYLTGMFCEYDGIELRHETINIIIPRFR